MTNLMKTPVLQLNASYEALRIITARRSLTLVTKGVAVVLVDTGKEIYPGIFLPSVIKLINYRHVPVRLQIVTRRNICLRDGNRCQYCGKHFVTGDLTLDHVIPRSQGGKNTWDNLVASCGPCNREKDNRTPQEASMPLLHRPLPANIHTPRFLLRSMGSEVEHWKKYLWHDNTGDTRYGTYVN